MKDHQKVLLISLGLLIIFSIFGIGTNNAVGNQIYNPIFLDESCTPPVPNVLECVLARLSISSDFGKNSFCSVNGNYLKLSTDYNANNQIDKEDVKIACALKQGSVTYEEIIQNLNVPSCTPSLSEVTSCLLTTNEQQLYVLASQKQIEMVLGQPLEQEEISIPQCSFNQDCQVGYGCVAGVCQKSEYVQYIPKDPETSPICPEKKNIR